MGKQLLEKPDKRFLSAKTNEQRRIIESFFCYKGGCLKDEMTEEEYRALVKKKYESLRIKEKALEKLGIDESQVQEIAPVEFKDFSNELDFYAKQEMTSLFETTWLFFSDTQIFAYSFIFSMTSDTTKERTEEYFYKDVTNFSSLTESVEIMIEDSPGCLSGSTSNNYKKCSIDNSKFSIVVPGDSFTCSMERTEENERIIQGMKQKLREKKNV